MNTQKEIWSAIGALVIFAGGTVQPSFGQAAAVAKISVECIDEAVEVASKVSGKAIGASSRAIVARQLAEATVKYGDDAIKAARNGGLELSEAAAKYGDDVWKYSSQAPSGARALAVRTEELLPLARKIGPEVLEMEAKAPGITKVLAQDFGDDAVRYLAKNAPAEDLTRLAGYARRADSLEAKKLLYETYQKIGAALFERIEWKTVLASGVSVAMITGAYKVGDGIQEGLKTIAEKNPNAFEKAASKIYTVTSLPILIPLLILGSGIAIMLLLRFRKWMSRGDEGASHGTT
ncbi:MAG: hypothetical protein NT118_12500 [Lentisphaerae bacterium]|nr:hypothetical protein [Lentisphaerota bacterium]